MSHPNQQTTTGELTTAEMQEALVRARDEAQQLKDWRAAVLPYIHPRKTLRDEFAMAAMTGLLANSVTIFSETPSIYASMAYEQADAMMQERSKQP